ncbi:dimer_Tnp_hAT domain-containing protein [Trichonephila clavipes]|uniref:Dimer_Tnp_hAT domain-containing protein n=1 Tax=Trichonephila clavipes TaxID=2585209 RepID=A0A8X7B8K1_TRICX|nr:dimer_Tnp_hAT domain-containing protein [Trichonephila clavipes]
MQLIDFESSSVWIQKLIETRKKLELIETRRLTSNVSKNARNGSLKTWNSIPNTFNCWKKLVRAALTTFPSNSACESLFSEMNNIGNRLADDSNSECIRLKLGDGCARGVIFLTSPRFEMTRSVANSSRVALISLVVKVTDSRLACHGFEFNAAEEGTDYVRSQMSSRWFADDSGGVPGTFEHSSGMRNNSICAFFHVSGGRRDPFSVLRECAPQEIAGIAREPRIRDSKCLRRRNPGDCSLVTEAVDSLYEDDKNSGND